MYKKRGKLFVISGPSGAGKSTLIDNVLSELKDFVRSVSVTTRPRRINEVNGKKYNFLKKSEFKKLAEDKKLLEFANYCGFDYGTQEEFVEKELSKGNNVILEIDVQGAIQVKEKKKDAFMIFISTSSMKILKNRLEKRNTESAVAIDNRIKVAENELSYQKYYDCILINNDYNEALLALKHILKTQKSLK